MTIKSVSPNSKEQIGTIIDLLSEGEVEGLVNGDASVYLDGTPLIDADNYVDIKSRTVIGSTIASDNTLTAAAGTFIDADVGKQIAVIGAGKFLATNATTTAGSKTVTGTWGASDFNTFVGNIKPYISVEGAGINGSEFRSTVSSVGINTMELDISVPLAVAGADIRQDLVTTVNLVTSDSAIELSSAPTDTISEATVVLFPKATAEDSLEYNFEQVKYEFRAGTQNQPISTIMGPNQAIVTAFNEEIKQTDPMLVLEANAELGIAAPGEIDDIRITFMFPSMIKTSTESGREYHTRVEFQIFFEYEQGGTWVGDSVVPIWGETDANIATRGQNAFTGTAAPAGFDGSGFVINQTKTKFTTDFELNLSQFKPFSNFRIKIKRITGDELQEDGTHYISQHQSFLQAVTGLINDKTNFPHSAYSAIEFKSGELSDVPTRSYEMRGVKIQVPTNYDPETRQYTRNTTTGAIGASYVPWDGKLRGDLSEAVWMEDTTHPNYTKVYSNNPAWVYYDLMTNNRYGLGEFLSSQQIDKYALYQIGRYCDELVPDGKGGTEPRFTCNLYIKDLEDAYTKLSDIASIFRSLLSWINGKAVVIQDRPKEPIYTFTKSNVIGGDFVYQSSSNRLRANRVNVTWTNPDRLYSAEVTTIDDSEDIINKKQIISKDIVAMGCTSIGQAKRLGLWTSLTEKLESTLISFQTAANAQFISPGDIIYVQDSDATGVLGSGRVSNTGSRTTTIIPLDRTITLDVDVYKLHLVYPDGGCYLQEDAATINAIVYKRGDLILSGNVAGEVGVVSIDSEQRAANLVDDSGNGVKTFWSPNSRIETQIISTGAGTVNSIEVSTAFSSIPNSEVIWSITNESSTNFAQKTEKFRVLSIAEDDGTFAITANLYIDDKFAAVDNGDIVYEREYEALPNFNDKVPAPRNINYSVSEKSTGSGNDTDEIIISGQDVTITWEKPLDLNTSNTYSFISGFEIRHTVTEDSSWSDVLVLGANSTSHTIKDVASGTYNAKVRTRDTLGRYSQWALVSIDFGSASASAPNSGNIISGITSGGDIDTVVNFDASSGLLSFSTDSFNIKGPRGNSYTLSSIATDYDFSSLTDGNSGFLLFDASASIWKMLEVYTDSVVTNNSAVSIGKQYWKELTNTNKGLEVVTGAVDVVTTEVINGLSYSTWPVTAIYTGGATLSSDFSEGDLVKFSSATPNYTEGANDWYGTVQSSTATSITTKEPINKPFTSGKLYKQAFKPEFNKDFIAFKINKISGSSYTLEKLASTISANSKTVKLVAEDYSIIYDDLGNNPSFAGGVDIGLTASEQGYINPEFRFTIDGVVGLWTASSTSSLTPDSTHTIGAHSIQVEVREAGTGASISLDTISIARIKSGQDSFVGILTNEAHVAPSNSDGTNVDLTGSGGTFEAYYGGVSITTLGGSFSISGGTNNGTNFSQTKSGLTMTIDESSGVYTLSDSSWTTSIETFDMLATFPDTGETITKTYTISKAIAGAAGTAVKLTASDYSIVYNSSGTNPTPTPTIVLTATAQNVDTPWFKFTGDIISDDVSFSATATKNFTVPVNYSSTPYTIRVGVSDGDQSEITFDSITISSVQPGQDTITVLLTNEAHTLPASSTGVVSSYIGSGTSIEVYEGSTLLPYDDTLPYGTPSWRVGTLVQSNITAGIRTGSTYADASNMTADNATITFPITVVNSDGGSTTINKVQSFSKSKQGVQGDIGATGDPGADGATGLKTATGFVYYNTATTLAGKPTTPTASSYIFSTGAFTGLTAGWSTSAPDVDPQSINDYYWVSKYNVTESSSNSNVGSPVFSVVDQLFRFTGLVSFNALASDGQTTIHGGSITTDTIELNSLKSNDILTNNIEIQSIVDIGKTTANGILRMGGKTGWLGNATEGIWMGYSGTRWGVEFGNSAGGDFFRWDPTGGVIIGSGGDSITLNSGNITVSGDIIATGNIKSGAVTTPTVASNAISVSGADDTISVSFIPSTAFTVDILFFDLNLDAGATVAYWWMLDLEAESTTNQVQVQILEEGVTKDISAFYQVPITRRNVSYMGQFVATGGSNRTIAIQAKLLAASPSITINNGSLVAIQLKR